MLQAPNLHLATQLLIRVELHCDRLGLITKRLIAFPKLFYKIPGETADKSQI